MTHAQNRLFILLALTFLAGAIRVYRLDYVPLRGDEAFSVRFWAEPPNETWQDLAAWEPHPIGTFVAFWGWKSLVGETEFAMRALPMLVNIMGVAVMMALARRIFGTWQTPAVWMLGLLWAVNPFQVWHSQDVRNYALWAVLSPLAMWLFLLALHRNRPRDWLLYGIAETLALYAFLLEPFFLVVQASYLLYFHRDKLRNAAMTWGLMAVPLIPLGIQLVRLAGSDYSGTATTVNLNTLVTRFLPTLLFGEGGLSFIAGLGLIAVLLAGLLRNGKRIQYRPTSFLLGLWLFLPLILLIVFATRMSIFRPRYVITITPALLLALIWIAFRAGRRAPLAHIATGVLVAASAVSLYAYFFTDPPKAPDWRGLASYIETRATSDDLVILSNVDPAFGYYYRGDTPDMPWSDIESIDTLALRYEGIFVQVGQSTSDISLMLQESAQFIPPASPQIKLYRSYEVEPSEIQFPLDLTLGDVAILRGYTLFANDALGVTLLLYWQPLRRTESEIVAFLHVTPPSEPLIVAQDDHAPLNGNASTTAWHAGDLLRDPFFIQPPAGQYELHVGMYHLEDGTRLPIVDADGVALGDSYLLTEIDVE